MPLTLSVVRSLVVEVADEAYAFPLAHIERMRDLSPTTSYGSKAVSTSGMKAAMWGWLPPANCCSALPARAMTKPSRWW